MESGLQQPEHQSAAKFEPGLAKQHLVNSDADAMIESVPGLLRPKPPKYIDGGDENGDEDDDLGPETNVDDAFDDFSKPDHLASYDTLVKQLCESPIDADYNYLSSDKLKSKIQNELISGTDNVGDSEDSEDEWNFYRPVKQNIQLQLYSRANSAILENPVESNEEVKLYNPKPDEENLDLDNQPSHHARSDHSEVEVEIDAVAEIDADEIIANSVEFHELNVTEEQKSYLKLKKNNIEDESSIAGEDFPVDKEPYREQQIQLIVEENKEEDMESHLNPNAAEFVPTSNAAPGLPQLMDQISSDLLAGSPLKQSQRALKNRQIPSEEEFQKEICRRPSEIDDSVCSDYSNDGPSTQEDPVKSDVDVTKQKTLIDLDQSEMSSTKAEFGDESNFSMVSEFYKTGLSTVDCSYTDSDRTDLEFSVSNAMATSMTPNDFKSAFEQEPDLNQVHELSDEDFMTDTHNGSLELENKNDVKNIIIANELLKENVEFDLHDFAPQQEQNAEMFSALAERRKSDNKNLFRNIHNIEHDSLGFSKNEDVPNSPTNNASSADCAPFPESQDNTLDIANELNKVKLQSTGINLSLDEPNEKLQFMQNPSDLNVRPTSAEPISNDLVFMAPIKEAEAMLSKFAEENLMYHKLDRRVECNEVQDLTSTNISFKNNTNVNLSESLQEFTGLEDQLSPQQFGMNTGAPHILKEKFVYEQKDVEETTPSSVTETRADENSLFTNEPGKLSFNDDKDSEPKAVVPVVDTVVTNNAMSAASATALATVKPVKHMKAATKTTKPTGSTNKLGFKTTTHISPIKSNTFAKTGGVTGSVTKKSTQSVTSKAKLTNVTVGKTAVSASTKSTSNKSTIGLKNQVSSSVTAKASSYTSTLSSAPKPKFVSTSASKLDSTSSEKIQTMANGDLKPASKVVLAPKTTSKPASSITITGLVNKTRTSLKTSSGPAVPSLAAAKPKPVSAKTVSCRLSSANAHSSTNSIALSTRPKTALTFTTNLTLKSKLSAGATTLKSPVIDKQIKETANKQISSVRNTSLAQKMRQSTANPTMNTSAKRVSLTPRAKTDANTASPTKKPAPISKLTSKMSSATAKLYSKTSIAKDSSVTSKPESNSNSEHEQPKLNTNTTMNIVTTNIEQDTPTKDISPVEPPTDNQLITAE